MCADRRALVVVWCVVSHNSPEDCLRLYSDLVDQTDGRWALVVADNSDDDAQVAVLRDGLGPRSATSESLGPGHVVHMVEANRGYLPTAAGALGRIRVQPDFVVVSNADLRIDPGFVAELARWLDCPAPVDVLAPAVLARGRDQNPYLVHRPAAWRLRRSALLLRNPVTAVPFRWAAGRRPRRTALAISAGSPIYAAHGACIVLHRSFFQKGGHLDHPQFLFGEEFFVAEQLLDLQGVARYAPALRVEHSEHGSIRAVRRRSRDLLQADAAAFWAARLASRS